MRAPRQPSYAKRNRLNTGAFVGLRTPGCKESRTSMLGAEPRVCPADTIPEHPSLHSLKLRRSHDPYPTSVRALLCAVCQRGEHLALPWHQDGHVSLAYIQARAACKHADGSDSQAPSLPSWPISPPIRFLSRCNSSPGSCTALLGYRKASKAACKNIELQARLDICSDWKRPLGLICA